MKKTALLIFASVMGGIISLGLYKILIEKETSQSAATEMVKDRFENPVSAKTNYVHHPMGMVDAEAPDFTTAAERTVPAVVHVKNVEEVSGPRTWAEYFSGIQSGKYIRGMGSGVIVTPDGFIVTNNHVIQGASELEVTLSNNSTYKAQLIGADPQQDIALIKIDAEDLDYLPFGDSDSIKLGQWVLAVGNPFNLTSTVTAGIISAKGRDLGEGNTYMPSFIQTDAAVNPGNSGGALVNTMGELIGINTAITSRTGSYVGYSFAVPSNNARKIVEDLMEYGDVKRAIIGITGGTLNPEAAEELGVSLTQGVYVASSSLGAKEAGIKEGDLIVGMDGLKIRKMTDLTAYVGTKRPGDGVEVEFIRKGKKNAVQVNLTEYETFLIEAADLEVTNATEEQLKLFSAEHGVLISRAGTSHQQQNRRNQLQQQFIIVAIDGQQVRNVQDVKEIMKDKNPRSYTQITFRNMEGRQETVTF